MGLRGPAPTPKAILKLRGSWRGKDDDEPKPTTGAPPCPDWLNQDAKAVWEQVVERLAPCGVVTHADENALARYCDCFVRWKRAAAFLDKNGSTYAIKGDDGKIKCVMPFPQVAEYSRLAGLLARLEAEFGLTPSGRARIQVPAPVEQAPASKARFFGRAG